MTSFILREVVDAADKNACLEIRRVVFCEEQGVSGDLEFDGLDDACRHFLALDGNRAVGTARIRPLEDGVVKFERIAVLKADRGRNAGRMLIEAALTAAVEDGHRSAMMHAQSYARPFYEKLGFQQDGDGFTEAGIPHIKMTRPL